MVIYWFNNNFLGILLETYQGTFFFEDFNTQFTMVNWFPVRKGFVSGILLKAPYIVEEAAYFYTGLMFITMGMIFEWATIPLLIMWPLMVWMYYRLARREEKDMEEEFGVDYLKYKENTGMFFPIITGNR